MDNFEDMLQRPAYLLAKEVVTDPGVGFSVRNVLLFAAGTNVLGLASCLAASAVTIGLKAISFTAPQRLPSAARDNRMTLWIISAALFVTALGALLKGALLPAMSGLLFAIGNIRIAESLSAKGHEGTTILSLLFKRPDLYINAGTALACLMAGHQALWVLPLVVISSVITLRNAWFGKAEQTGRPKTMIAAATLISAAISFMNGNILIGVSHLLGSAIILNVERRIIRRTAQG